MYCCIQCGCLFEEPQVITENHGFSVPPYETFYGCPICGDGFAETKRCLECGNYVTDNYADTASGWICENCYTLKTIGDD